MTDARADFEAATSLSVAYADAKPCLSCGVLVPPELDHFLDDDDDECFFKELENLHASGCEWILSLFRLGQSVRIHATRGMLLPDDRIKATDAPWRGCFYSPTEACSHPDCEEDRGKRP